MASPVRFRSTWRTGQHDSRLALDLRRRHARRQIRHQRRRRLGPDNMPRPDGLLRIVPECGGQARVDAKGYLRGAPELVVEVAGRAPASFDAREKHAAYRRAGVREYLLWRTDDPAVDWWVLEADKYRLLAPAPTACCEAVSLPASGLTSRPCWPATAQPYWRSSSKDCKAGSMRTS